MRNIKKFLFVLCTVYAVQILVSCEKEKGPALPNELLGSWSQKILKVCTQTYTFRKYDYTFNEVCGSQVIVYDEKIEKVYENENMFKTPDNMHIVWHIEGNYLYLHKTNPGDPKPNLGANWWTNYTPYVKQSN
ncbi:MAG: hypothetical protein N2662_00990 [Bacteroidales bacterium]|nr:hypothetical protein [Bacteroidales bacterium]